MTVSCMIKTCENERRFKMAYAYLYGMILATNSFMLKDSFIAPDSYSEISEKYRLPGGDTGNCATILAGLGVDVKLDGKHI